MFKKTLTTLAVLAVVFVVLVSRRPDEFKVSRTAVVPAAPAKVFALINDLHAWEAWSPWAKLDPNSKSSFGGPASGVGASMTWSGNNKVGEGTMTITDSQPNQAVRYRLDFVRPMKSTSQSEFVLAPEGKGTQVTWTMTGKNNFVAKAMGLIMDCDKMVGDQFEQGLSQLSAAATQ